MEKSIQQRMFKGISRWRQSGLTQKAWCEKNKIAYATFHYWYKRYRRSEVMAADQDAGGGFVQLRVDSTPTGCWCELQVPGGRKLVFCQPVSADFLQTLIG